MYLFSFLKINTFSKLTKIIFNIIKAHNILGIQNIKDPNLLNYQKKNYRIKNYTSNKKNIHFYLVINTILNIYLALNFEVKFKAKYIFKNCINYQIEMDLFFIRWL